mmetsp:Transcript_14795/g.23392  ORF Transcript_14795/g.23392 Transcript_14795/m.23392 type:complete len:618 (-) Transcript_14795:51-1904(-)
MVNVCVLPPKTRREGHSQGVQVMSGLRPSNRPSRRSSGYFEHTASNLVAYLLSISILVAGTLLSSEVSQKANRMGLAPNLGNPVVNRRIVSGSREDISGVSRMLLPLLKRTTRLLDEVNGSDQFNENNPYTTRGEYAPPEREMNTFEPMKVTGVIPPEINGMFVFMSPVANTWPPSHTYTNLDGHGMVHVVKLSESTAQISSHVLRTPVTKLEREAKWDLFGRPGDLRSMTGLMKLAVGKFIFSPLLGLKPYELGSSNTNILHYNGRWFAFEESMCPFEFQIDEKTGNVTSVGCMDLNGSPIDKGWQFPMCAHPKIDPKTGHLAVVGYNPDFPSAAIKYGSYGKGGDGKSFEFKLPSPAAFIPFLHDLGITENHAILIDSSYEFAFPSPTTGLGPILTFNNKKRAKFGVFSKNLQGRSEEMSKEHIQWFEVEPLVINHIANSWEEEDVVVVHAPVAREPIDIFAHKGYFGCMTEFRLNLTDGSVETFDYSSGISAEFPKIHPKLTGYPTSFAYTTVHAKDLTTISGLAKWDMKKRELVGRIQFGDNNYGVVGEPVFIPYENTSEEDDGVVITSVFNDESKVTTLRLYDAKTFESKPIAILESSEHIPFGLHGLWHGL